MKTYRIYWDHLNGNAGYATAQLSDSFLEWIGTHLGRREVWGLANITTTSGRTLLLRLDQLTSFGYEEER